jgi:hypothetical protein
MLPTYLLSLHQPPSAPAPTLTVTAKGRVYPSKALLAKLNLRAGQPADLLPPSADYPNWQLDLRPTAPRRICWYADTSPRIRGVRLPSGLVAPEEPLLLALCPTEQSSAGLYLLTPVACPDASAAAS